ncbi:SusC/RagA family TonB-linked outer membrane protein [Rhizosphaericola mali]|uniref:SusC/RagA family TonB-linked outer membrane protein n=1 Tax=Rhizosphaericola mali TaxID=2545455 RepID=UPI001CD9FD3E|nr:TonB-dependent receptor [Rhizosphaericola mali]
MCTFFIFCFSTKANAQEKITITGTVRDNLNAIVNGASITNLNSHKVVLTSSSGTFSIDAHRGDSLKASYIGYQDIVWKFTDLINYDLVLNASSGSLNDVVVTGFGQKERKSSLVGSIATVNAQDLQHPVANLSTMLAGRIAGVVGVQRSGLPGSNSADIWIRGIQSFGSNPTGPLIIVDGVQGRNINDYDPEDIQSFSVLKDAAATALYGSLGANGVILITTKRGSEAKSQIMGQFLQGITTFTKLPKMADAGTFMNLKNEAEEASGYAPSYTQDYIDSTLDPNANHYVYPNVDWFKQVFKSSSMNRKATVSATGGSDNTQYYVSLNYYDETSMIKQDPSQSQYNAGTRFSRYNFTSNVDMRWTKTTKFSLSIQGYITSFNQPGTGAGGSNYTLGSSSGAQAAFSDAMNASPVRVPAFYPGNLVAGVAEGSTPSPNPWASVTQTGYDNIYTSQLNSTLSLQQDFGFWVKGLSANAQYSFDNESQNENYRTRQRSIWYLNQAQPYNADGTLNLQEVIAGSDNLNFGRLSAGNRQNTLQGQINYSRSFGEHHVTGMLVYNQLSSVDPYQSSYTAYIPHHQQNYAAKLGYSYKNTYLFEFNLGYNGSEDYAPNKRFGWFPAPGVSWIVSNEDFFKPLSKVFQYFKVRYTDGLSGAPGTGLRFGYLTFVTTGANGASFGTASSLVNYSGVNISQYGANVQWAVSHTRDLGVDFHTANDHLQFVLDYFHSHRTKVFLSRADFPDYAGLQYQPVGNLGVVDASGFEGQVTLTPIKIGKNMTLGFNGTFTYNTNKLVDDDEPSYADPYQDRKGHNINAQYGYIADGLFKNQAQIDNSADQSALGGNPRPGDIKYKDLNGDGVINQYDQTKISNGDVPKWIAGAGFNFTYGDFYISAFFQANIGSYRTLSGIAQSPFAMSDDGNVFANATDRWTPENPIENPFYPRLGYGSNANANNDVASTWWVKNISFVRFKTLDIGYNFKNRSWMKSMGMRNLQVYFDGINLMYWSPFKLWDPELNTGNGNVYPNTRNLSIGVRANF